METRTTKEVIGGIILFMATVFGVTVLDADEGYLPYSCDLPDKDDMFCYKLSRVNDAGFNRYCYYDRDKPQSFKRCDVGWVRLQIESLQPSTINKCPYVLAYTDNGRFVCNGVGGQCFGEDMVPLAFEDLG